MSGKWIAEVKRYKVYLSAPTECWVTVEAEDPDDALEKLRFPSICGQCSGWGSNYTLDISWDAVDWDKADITEVEE